MINIIIAVEEKELTAGGPDKCAARIDVMQIGSDPTDEEKEIAAAIRAAITELIQSAIKNGGTLIHTKDAPIIITNERN